MMTVVVLALLNGLVFTVMAVRESSGEMWFNVMSRPVVMTVTATELLDIRVRQGKNSFYRVCYQRDHFGTRPGGRWVDIRLHDGVCDAWESGPLVHAPGDTLLARLVRRGRPGSGHPAVDAQRPCPVAVETLEAGRGSLSGAQRHPVSGRTGAEHLS